ncbi:hypothetical protein [Candidatus Methylacidithermus pantelleriae]|uniref:Uncharacterized protein n=1 Tax=Candidatus Methylacidithermus pantelleriae TaxID=2744239 RepID=A0A8J2FRD6_9BACT|nr:hypothetical protein [Candidatus Methylacidithermus pantelleriae]CAF0689715.1 hypothetical protein MPNT_10331 [Candidatus Methylacidithermus pantelleriae]
MYLQEVSTDPNGKVDRQAGGSAALPGGEKGEKQELGQWEAAAG